MLSAILSGTRGGLLARDLTMKFLGRPRLKIEVSFGGTWHGEDEPPREGFSVSVKNPSPHQLQLTLVGIAFGDHLVFPPELCRMVGEIKAFSTLFAWMEYEELRDLLDEIGVSETRRRGRAWVIAVDGLGKEWRSRRIKFV